MPAEFEDDSALPLKDRLINYFESEKPYLSKDISMQEVAMRLFTNKSYLSKTINMEMNKNFRELVNYFRVKEAMRIFSASPDMSMNELRDRSGFNNNASFTSAFKLNTGCTPGEWCRDMKNRIYEEERRTVNGKGQDI
jgi:YesN/AraC family two-component response regulator